jgi:hypothetical protein
VMLSKESRRVKSEAICVPGLKETSNNSVWLDDQIQPDKKDW